MTTLQEPTEHAPLPSSTRSDDAPAAKTGGPVRVAVVDDDDDFRCALCLHLSDEGFEAIACPGGRAALDFLSADTVDVIMLDWRMPDLNGMEVLRELRRRDIMTPAIFLTGLGEDVIRSEEHT